MMDTEKRIAEGRAQLNQDFKKRDAVLLKATIEKRVLQLYELMCKLQEVESDGFYNRRESLLGEIQVTVKLKRKRSK